MAEGKATQINLCYECTDRIVAANSMIRVLAKAAGENATLLQVREVSCEPN
jgi:hypothetical protein